MSRRSLALAVLAVLAVACGDKKEPPRRATPPTIPDRPASAQGAAGAKGPEVELAYSSVGKRDPFKSFINDLRGSAGPVVTHCNTPLGRFELEQLKLVAVVTGLADPMAMVEAPTGVGYSIHRGSCLGKNGGVVAAIRSGEVVVAEWALKADGTREKTQTVIRLPKDQSLNLEE